MHTFFLILFILVPSFIFLINALSAFGFFKNYRAIPLPFCGGILAVMLGLIVFQSWISLLFIFFDFMMVAYLYILSYRFFSKKSDFPFPFKRYGEYMKKQSSE